MRSWHGLSPPKLDGIWNGSGAPLVSRHSVERMRGASGGGGAGDARPDQTGTFSIRSRTPLYTLYLARPDLGYVYQYSVFDSDFLSLRPQFQNVRR